MINSYAGPLRSKTMNDAPDIPDSWVCEHMTPDFCLGADPRLIDPDRSGDSEEWKQGLAAALNML